MKILLCPDKFKGSLTAEEVCRSIRKGILRTNPTSQIVSHPMADGGDGSVDILIKKLNLNKVALETLDPLGRKISTAYYISKDAAFIELASASGISLLKTEERNPLYTSTEGTGLIIKNALDHGFKKIYLFIGGSATNDGGIGIANALGFDFLSKEGTKLKPLGQHLEKIKRIENQNFFDFESVDFTVLCDVKNPMHGTNGAAHIYGKQKGATPEEIQILDKGLKNYDDVLKQQFNQDIHTIPGMGAAGAVGASLVGLMQAQLRNGFEMIAQLTDFETQLKEADLVITGEGKIDSTSFNGKVVGNVLDSCKKNSKPCGVVGGIIEECEELNYPFAFSKSILPRANHQSDAMSSAKKYLIEIGEEIGSLLDHE